MLVAELIEELEAPKPQLLSGGVLAREAERAPIRAKRLRAQARRHELGAGLIEEALEPPAALVRIFERPQLLEGRRDREPELDRSAAQRPGDGAAEVVLLGEPEVEALAPGAVCPCIEIRLFRNREEVLGMTPSDLIGVGGGVEQLDRELPDRVEHAQPAARPPADEALDDK